MAEKETETLIAICHTDCKAGAWKLFEVQISKDDKDELNDESGDDEKVRDSVNIF